VTAALALRISLSLDQVDATVVDRVVGSIGGKIYAAESPESADAIPHPRRGTDFTHLVLASRAVPKRPNPSGDLEARLRRRWGQRISTYILAT
jgi:hypothetical protein